MTERLLRVTTRNFVAGVVYRKVAPGTWKPVAAAPILAWVLAHEDQGGMDRFLKGPGRRQGWRYEWLKPRP